MTDSAIDRMSEGYVPDFDIDAAIGEQGQLFVARIIDAMAANRHEVKTDEKYAVTGNVFIECMCMKRGGWHLSGIAATTAEIWCQVLGDAVIVATTEQVRNIARYYWGSSRVRDGGLKGSHPTKGIVIPVQVFLDHLVNGFPQHRQGALPL